MAFIGSVEALLKADNSDFKSKMDEAGQATEKLDKNLKKFGLGFGGVALLATAFRAIVDHARDLNGELDANQTRAKAFAGGLTEAKKAALDVGVSILGTVNGLGEWIGKQIAIVRYGKDQVALTEQIAQQTEATLKIIEKQKAIYEEVNRIKAQTAEVERKVVEEQTKQLDIATQIHLANVKLQALKDDAARIDGDKVKMAQAELEIAKARAELEKLYGTQKKETGAVEKKAAEEKAKDAEKLAKVQEQIDEEQFERDVDRIRLAREGAEAKAAAQAAIIPVLDDELKVLQKQGMSREQIIAVLRQQGFGEEDVLNRLKEQTEELKGQIVLRKGREDTELSDRVLEDKVANLSKSLSARRSRSAATPGGVGGMADYDPFIFEEQKELDRAKSELAAREQIRSQVSRFGESGAQRFHSGNIPEFERLLNFVVPKAEGEKQTALLFELNERLKNSGLFPKF